VSVPWYGHVGVSGDDNVTSNRAVRQMADRIRELECQLGRKTLQVEILKEALDKSRSKNRPGMRSRSDRTVPGERRGQDPRRLQIESARPSDGKSESASALL